VLEFAQFTILAMLMKHILHEKIEFATTLSPSKKKQPDKVANIIIQEEIIKESLMDENNHIIEKNNEELREVKNINGSIKRETDKALLIQFDNGAEIWIPKSKIHSGFNNTKNILQKFSIDSWILSKNKIIVS
jgi:hypothetical protein